MKKLLILDLSIMLRFMIMAAIISMSACGTSGIKNGNSDVAPDIGKPNKDTGEESIAGGPVTEYEFTSTGWATFGIALPKGQARAGLKVGDLTTQADVKNRWDDDSIKYAILTVKVQDVGKYEISESNQLTTSFTPIIPSAKLSIDLEKYGDVPQWGVFESILPNTVSSDVWLNGPLVKEWRVRDIPVQNGTKHPFLSNVWDIRIYNDGTGTVDVTVENVRDVAIADAVVYSTNITINDEKTYQHAATERGAGFLSYLDNQNYGRYQCTTAAGVVTGNTIRLTSGALKGEIAIVNDYVYPTMDVFSVVGKYFPSETREQIKNDTWEKIFFHRYGTRWHKVFEINGFVEAGVKINFAPFIEAGAIPEYMQNVNSIASVVDESEWGKGDILGLANMVFSTSMGGGRGEIGPYPVWAMRFIVHQTMELRKQLLMNGDASGSYGVHFTKNDPSIFVTVDEKLNYYLDTRSSADNKPLNNMRGNYHTFSHAHITSLAFIPYLVTGTRYYNDEVLHHAHYAIKASFTPRNSELYDSPILWRGEVRSFGWILRNIADAAYYLPDDCEYKEHFKSIVDINLKNFDSIVEKEPNKVSPLGIIKLNYMIESTGTEYDYNWVQISPWQSTFVLWAVQRAIDHGAQGGRIARDLLLQALLEPAYNKNTGFDPRYLAGYYVKVGREMKTDATNIWFPSWTEVFQVNYADTPEPDWSYGYVVRLAVIVAKKAGKPWADDVHKFFWDMFIEKNQINNILNSDVYSQFSLAYNYD